MSKDTKKRFTKLSRYATIKNVNVNIFENILCCRKCKR